ncbi:17-beta-hydroxysteroid dehydrogenase type 1 isoform X1 [Neofelis nebulosa]|uniref:17-beta-hydroxysteroid dehydrogenase type 1 isoform X1 n=1 Tax=Neofelis nebulosa TaxID=61452 RepID=UPI00272D1E42|nr:17-beta-hydroxysteroid dehydrogenase type 1 isoform X1 [Neofelis nebulosa]
MDRTVVLITGCSSGIGLHLALRLASDPSRRFKVYATLRDLRAQGPLREAAQSRGCPPGSLEMLQLDVRDADSVAAARARVTEGRVDVLVCNAGRGLLGPLEVQEAGAVGSVLDVNVAGTVRTLQAFLPDMKRRRSGRVLGCHSTPFTAPASLRSKVYARVWRFCCRPSGSSESPPHPQSPLNPDFGNPRTLTCWSHSHAGPSPLRLTFVVCQAQYWALGTRYLTSATQLGNGGPKRLGDWPKVTQLKGACQREPHRVRPGAHRLPGEAGGRPGRSAGRRGRRDPRPLLPLPAPFGADLPRGGAGPGGGDRGLPRRAALPAPRAALLQHGALPAPGAHASHRPQRPQLRRRHAPRGVLRRARRRVRCRPGRPRARLSSRRPAIKAWPAAVCRALLCDPRGARFWWVEGDVCDRRRVQRVGDLEGPWLARVIPTRKARPRKRKELAHRGARSRMIPGFPQGVCSKSEADLGRRRVRL